MPTIVETEVYTLDELEALGDESSTQRALDWMREAFRDVAVEYVSESLTDAVDEAFGRANLVVECWDYYRSDLSINGTISVDDARIMDNGVFSGLSWPSPLIDSLTYRTPTAKSYGRVDRLWLYVTEDGPDWASDEYDALCVLALDWLREVEARLTRLMVDEFDYLTGREYLTEVARANDYTFTAEGKRFG